MVVFRVANCATDNKTEDKLDETLRRVHQAVEEVKTDLKEKANEKAEELVEELKDRYMTEELEEGFEFIKNIMENLKEFGKFDDSPFQTALPVILALIKKAQDKGEKDWRHALPKTSQIESAAFELHRHVAELALNVYEASAETTAEAQARQMGLKDPQDIMFTYFTDKENEERCPKFMLLADHDTQALVLSIRGTFSVTDILIDVICDEEEFLDGYAHRGILR